MDTIAQVIHERETCAAIKQAKRLKPLWYGGQWLKYKYGEAWQIDYITLLQTRQGKHYVLTMVETTTGWLETYPVPHATTRNTILGLEKQVLWRHGTPERIESDNGTHFRNKLIDTWAKEHGIEWVYHIPYHAPASGEIERYNGLLKTALRATGAGTFKHWDTHLAKATWLVNTRGSVNRAGPAQSKLLRTVEGDKVPVVHIKNMLGKTVWVTPASGKGKPIRGIAFPQGPGCTWWVMREDGEVRCVPQGDLILEQTRLVMEKAEQENQRQNANDDPARFMPQNDPEWDPNTSVGIMIMIKQYQELILYGIQHGVLRPKNLAKFYDIKQENNENPSAFHETLCEAARKWTDLNPEEETNQTMLNMLFIGQSAADIRKKLQKVDGAGGMSISQLTEIAYKVYNNWDETEKREK
ncbi:hypothetical protein QYF61_007066 [Mycteria americana]|uniref:Integrase catalytic domain-containing protein n=1 Tax=Mycteria americana TaxID=33587 RepID=A0AAN7N516_MYCAM|nr:hypothetical protein QYF61_007066 [Mycteria americana]